MPKRANNNLRIKRNYLVWLKDAKGLAEASIDKAAAAISTYERYLDGKDFRAFHSERTPPVVRDKGPAIKTGLLVSSECYAKLKL